MAKIIGGSGDGGYAVVGAAGGRSTIDIRGGLLILYFGGDAHAVEILGRIIGVGEYGATVGSYVEQFASDAAEITGLILVDSAAAGPAAVESRGADPPGEHCIHRTVDNVDNPFIRQAVGRLRHGESADVGKVVRIKRAGIYSRM